MMPKVNVNIQPAIIRWALSQTSAEDLGAKLMDNIKHWLDGTKVLLFIKLKISVRNPIFLWVISF